MKSAIAIAATLLTITAASACKYGQTCWTSAAGVVQCTCNNGFGGY